MHADSATRGVRNVEEAASRGANFPAELGVNLCHKIPRPAIAHTLLRLERAPAMDGSAGRS
eukprot:6069491-Prymnesium_polylepis.2